MVPRIAELQYRLPAVGAKLKILSAVLGQRCDGQPGIAWRNRGRHHAGRGCGAATASQKEAPGSRGIGSRQEPEDQLMDEGGLGKLERDSSQVLEVIRNRAAPVDFFEKLLLLLLREIGIDLDLHDDAREAGSVFRRLAH